MNRWKTTLFLLCVTAMSSAAYAQGIANSFNELRLLVRAGDRISITNAEGRETTGKITNLSTELLVLAAGEDRLEFRETDVASIRQRQGDPLANGALWGLAIGGGIGVLGGALIAEDGATAGIGAALYGGIGAGIGAGVDALINKQRVIYERRSAGANFGVAPMLSHSRKGALLSIAF